MLIVEGPDMIGKTTFCRKLRVELSRLRPDLKPPVLRHLGPEFKMAEARRYLPLIKQWMIYDRFHLSDVVYRQSDDKGLASPMVGPERTLVEAGIIAAGGMVVMLLAAPAEYNRFIKERYVDGEQLFSRPQCFHANVCFLTIAQKAKPRRLWRPLDPLVDLAFFVLPREEDGKKWNVGQWAGLNGPTEAFAKFVAKAYLIRQDQVRRQP